MTKGIDGTSTGFRAMELTDDCRNVKPSSDTQVTVTPNREGPAMFYHEESYYLWVSWPISAPERSFMLSPLSWLVAAVFARVTVFDLRVGVLATACADPAGKWHNGLGAHSNVCL